ncbi:hypothetical protein HNY73_017331 [Argiope bruennichi]|uniref:Uncharacterized protein n=1 Tax=Argiope bruennichi TaxID=94029 RepID=A0A8T0EMH9_ARGBR|nr:hypothetical protein HNY73_017331 [Argiope bruennichi]
MDYLKRERTQLRRLFTKSLKEVENAVKTQPNPSPELDAKILLSPRNSSTLLLTVLVKIINKDRSLTIRGLFDTGAQRSFIKKDIVDKLGLEPVDQEMLSHGLLGGSETKQKSHNVYNITLQSLCSNFRHNISVLDEKKICGAIPRVSNPDIFPILKRKNIELSDTGEDTPEIDLLIGADYLGVLLTGSIEHIDKNLVAIKTKLNLSEYDDVFNEWIREGIIEIELITLRHCRVVFGASPSPFLLEATIAHHLENVSDGRKETARQLQKSFYVDNCITSLETREEAAKFISEAKELMSAAKFDLRGWVTSEEIVEETKKRYIPILGLSWDTENDELSCNSAIKISEENITKRTLLSIAQRIYDPIGFTSPTALIPKIILQKTWKRKINWDDVLPPDICNEFLAWYKHINLLKDCKIPRRLIANPFKDCQISLHCFSDASEASYAACIFLRAEYNGKVSVQLVASKSRVSPTKEITIPRLELLGALILSRLYCQVTDGLELIQKESFAGSKMKALKNMQTFKDDSDILKVRTKLILGDEEENFKCPILLPGNHEIIRRLIHQKHCELQHAGLRILISNLRENYWIISVNKIAKQVSSHCITCKRFKA